MMDKRVRTGREEWLFGLAFLWVQFVLSASGRLDTHPQTPSSGGRVGNGTSQTGIAETGQKFSVCDSIKGENTHEKYVSQKD